MTHYVSRLGRSQGRKATSREIVTAIFLAAVPFCAWALWLYVQN